MALRTQDGIPIGNQVDKARLVNPISRALVAGFDRSLMELVRESAPRSIHEAGCGEGRVARLLAETFGVAVRATDFSRDLIDQNRSTAPAGVEFLCRSIYEVRPPDDAADVVVCCEVLEQLEQPRRALAALRPLGAQRYVFSVPREPLWRAFNVARGKYLHALGNTPGHLNHWSGAGFVALLAGAGFRTIQVRSPLPWTMCLCELARS